MGVDGSVVVRLVVDTIDQRHACPLQSFRRRHIRENHEFLDNAVRKQTDRFCDSRYVAPFVVGQHRLGQIKIDRAALPPALLDDFGQSLKRA